MRPDPGRSTTHHESRAMKTPERITRPAADATNKRRGEVSVLRTRCAQLRGFAGAAIVAIAAIGCTPDAATQQKSSQSSTSDVYTVVAVVDGDTLDATSPAGDLERIRLLGIDTPERGECGYTEAADRLQQLAGPGTAITVVGDDSQAERDVYDRLLAYLELGDGTDIGLLLIADGHAHEYTYNGVPHERADEYRAAQHDTITGC